MLRRTLDMRQANGESIVTLPPRHDEVLYCELDAEERAFYRALYERSKVTFDGLLVSGHVNTKYIEVRSTALF
jgi:SNF2 family DNA or RNA helicase